MRTLWGRNPHVSSPRSTSRFYKLGVERLEDRNLLNGDPLSFVGTAAVSLLPPPAPTVITDAQLFIGPVPADTAAIAHDANPSNFNLNAWQKFGPDPSGPGLQFELGGTGTPASQGVAPNGSLQFNIGNSNLSQAAATVVFGGAHNNVPPIGDLILHTSDGQTIIIEIDEIVIQRGATPAIDPRVGDSATDAGKSRLGMDRGPGSPDLSELAFVASKVEAREIPREVVDETKFLLAGPTVVASTAPTFISAQARPHEVELVTASASDAYMARIVWPALLEQDLGLAVAAAAVAGAVPAGESEVALNQGEIAQVNQATDFEAAAVTVEKQQASLLDQLPVDFRAVDAALNELLSEIEALSGDLAGWLDIPTAHPWVVAAGVVAVTGVGGWYLRRNRLRRTRQQHFEEESSRWLFTQSHGFATDSTL